MNAKEFDIEKLIKDDVKSIEIDQDFKARLKTNIMKNDTSSREKVISLRDAKEKREEFGKNNNNKSVKRYLKIASSFAIVGVFGIQFAMNGLPNAISKSKSKIEHANKLVVTESQVYSIGDLKVNVGNDEKVLTEEGKKEIVNEETVDKNIKTEDIKNEESNEKPDVTDSNETKTEDTVGSNNQADGGKEVVKENPETEEPQENAKDNGKNTEAKDATETPVEVATADDDEVLTKSDNNGLGNSKTIIDSKIDDDIIKNTDKVSYSAKVENGVVNIDILDNKILLNYAEKNGIQFYYGNLENLEESKFDVDENTIFMKVNENNNEMIYNAKEGKKVIGIKSLDGNLFVVVGSGKSEKVDLVKIDLKSKEAQELYKDCQNLIFNKDCTFAAFEKGGAVKIVNLINGESISRVGKGVAWSPDGEYVSYVKSEIMENQDGKKQTTSVIAAYNVVDKTETKVLKSELIDKSDDEVMSRYNYGKHLWEKNGKCIYLIREDMNIITENDLEKIIVKKIIFE